MERMLSPIPEAASHYPFPTKTGPPEKPQQLDNETLAQAIERHKQEKARREPLLADQGKMEGGLDEPKV
jgi:hypothetical protein